MSEQVRDNVESGEDERNGSVIKQGFIHGPDKDDPSAEYCIKWVLHWTTWMEIGLFVLAIILAAYTAYTNPLNLHPIVWAVLLGYNAGKLPTIFRGS